METNVLDKPTRHQLNDDSHHKNFTTTDCPVINLAL
jgi:hypothetical protein